MKNNINIFSLLMSLMLFACGGEKEPQAIDLGGTPVKVTTIQAGGSTTETVATQFVLNGTVTAKETAAISTRVMGTISQVAVQEGQKVRQGQVLAQISSADLQAQRARIKAQIAQAKAALKNTGQNYQRFKNLYESKSITQKEFNDMEMQLDIAKSRVTAAEEALKELQVQLGYATITAPFSGVVSQKMAQVGSMANPGMPLFMMESAGNQVITVDVPASQIKRIQLKDAVAISLPDLGEKLQGKVSLINPSATHQGHQYKVEIKPSSTSQMSQLFTGMNAKVAFSTETVTTATDQPSAGLWLPKSALIKQGQLTGLYTVSQQNTALLRWVQLGATTADKVEVLSGITTEDQVIMQAEGRLYNGVKITK